MKPTKNPNLLVVYGAKPRASKTSKRYTYGGLKFFLYSNKAKTNGVVLVFLDIEPYPMISVIAREDKSSLTEVHDWISVNIEKIRKLVMDYRNKIQVPLESWLLINKNEDKMKINYDIRLESKKGYRLCLPEHQGRVLYLYVNMNEAPTKRSKTGSVIIDSELVLKEYLRRINDDSIL